MTEFLLLLLPVAAASGWYAARRSSRKAPASVRQGDHSPVYFRGLNYLINEEPDKAIDLLVQALEVDSDTVETHLALGSLFRRRGETERAIRIHQNLIARPTLSREQRAQALLELGRDYLRAGLLDRAESLFKELTEMGLLQRAALESLLLIYQDEKDWRACLGTAEKLQPLTPKSLTLQRAHYYCELAGEAAKRKDRSEASALLKKALATNRQCIRALHLQARMALGADDANGAARLLLRAIDLDVSYLPEVLDDLREAARRSGNSRHLDIVHEVASSGDADGSVLLACVDQVREVDGAEAAIEALRRSLRKHPSLGAVLRLLELRNEGGASELVSEVQRYLRELIADRTDYQCNQCGYQAKLMHWHCPGCKSWSTIERRPYAEQ